MEAKGICPLYAHLDVDANAEMTGRGESLCLLIVPEMTTLG